MKILLQLALFLILFNLIQNAYSQDIEFQSGNKQVSLIELYTSQGCSSCPPADKWLSGLKHEPDLWIKFVPVAFHVDYWNNIGWKDIFSKNEFSNRQRQHRKQGHVKVVYTPGFFLNGKEWKRRFRSVPNTTNNQISGNLQATLNNNILIVNYDSSKPILNAKLNVGVLGFGYQTPVKAGENSNRVLAEDFVLLSHTEHIGSGQSWKVTLPRKVMPPAEKYGLAIWVSEGNNLKPLQSTGGWLPDNYY